MHHKELGKMNDPDLIKIMDGKSSKSKVIRTYLSLFFNLRFWLGSAFGELHKMKSLNLVFIILWWIVLCVIIHAIFGVVTLVVFLLSWLITRITVYHSYRVLLELADHAFLNPTSLIDFTRTMPSKSPLTFFLHPHNDNYHIAHHLYPFIPLANLAKAHKILMKTDLYANAIHCEGYFWGDKSLLKSFLGTFKKESITQKIHNSKQAA
jgi:fatty acid desaturase